MKQLMLKYSFLPLLVLLTSCWKEPNYPKEPEIEPSYVTQKTIRDLLDNPVAEVTIAIKFKDGDGDLGLNDEDILKPPFNDVPGNKFVNNYFVETLIEQNGVYVLYETNITDAYTGRFLRLDPDNKGRTIEGELRRSFEVPEGFDITDGTKMKFRIQIADRSLNLSNTIETEPITLLFPR